MKIRATFHIVVEAEAEDASYPARCTTDEERLESERELADQLGVLGYLNNLEASKNCGVLVWGTWEERVTLEAI